MFTSLITLSFFFFFSSRRRHTRFDCDWSSDVCSSDLESTGNRKVTAFSYHARRPFHPDRFATLLQKGLRRVFRAKGFFWLATRMEEEIGRASCRERV